MNTPRRAQVWYGWWGGLLVVGSLLGGGCTAGSPPVALEQARTAYTYCISRRNLRVSIPLRAR